MNNKIKTVYIIFFLSIINVSCSAPTPTSAPAPTLYPSQQQSNFAFRFEYIICDTNILDTFNDTYTRGMIVEPDITIPLSLTESQIADIYKKMIEINFFDYPEVFTIPIPKNGIVGRVTPATQYHITVRNGDLTKSLSWLDEIIDPKMPEADRLRELFQLIFKIIEEHPEYQKLPEPKAGCA